MDDGTLWRTYSYDAWGNILSVQTTSGIEITSAADIANLQSLKYRGYVYDRETGFYYLQSRYYDPVTHRFINADGLVSTGTGILGYNMFAYCNNNPITLSDYNGKCGDPTCVNCNPFWNEYLSDPVNLEWQYKINPDFRINDCSLYYVGSITITKTRIIKNSSEVYVSATYRQYYKYDKDGGIINDSIYSTLSCIDIRIPDFTDINSITLTMGIQDTYFESVEISQSVFKKYVFWDTAFEFYFMGANIDILYNDGTKDNINVNLSGLSELMWGA